MCLHRSNLLNGCKFVCAPGPCRPVCFRNVPSRRDNRRPEKVANMFLQVDVRMTGVLFRIVL